MPTLDEHLDQFEHNLRVSSGLASAGDYDWAVTALFYAALHLGQAYMTANGSPPRSHRERDKIMTAAGELRPILNHYRTLRMHSENARYECRRFSRAEYESLRDGVFQRVSTHVRSLLGVSS